MEKSDGDRKINKIHRGDLFLIIAFFALMWTTLLFVVFQVRNVSSTLKIANIATSAALIVGIVSSSAQLATMTHLMKNKKKIYEEDIANLADQSL